MFNRKFDLFLLLFIFIAVLLVAPVTHAQDVTPEPTLAATLAPAPTEVPPVVTPAPVDTGAVPQWAFLVIIVSVLEVVTIAGVGIVQAAKLMPEWARPIITSGLNSGVDQLDLYAKGTLTTLDDAVVAELRAKLLELESKINAVPSQTARAIENNNAVQAQKVSG